MGAVVIDLPWMLGKDAWSICHEACIQTLEAGECLPCGEVTGYGLLT